MAGEPTPGGPEITLHFHKRLTERAIFDRAGASRMVRLLDFYLQDLAITEIAIGLDVHGGFTVSVRT